MTLGLDELPQRNRAWFRKPEGVRSRSVALVVLQPLAADGRMASSFNPPQAVVRVLHLPEPILALSADF